MKARFMIFAKRIITKNELKSQVLSVALMLFLFGGITMAEDSGLPEEKIDWPALFINQRLQIEIFITLPILKLALFGFVFLDCESVVFSVILCYK